MRHLKNPYRSPTVPGPEPERWPFLATLWLGAIILVLLGCAVVGLGMLPSDAPGFFLLFGAHLIACGALGAIGAWTTRRGGLRLLFRWMSVIVNAALAFRIAMLILSGTVRGPLIVAAPLLLGLPATLNVVSAACVRANPST
ncbi:MAG: hypothetical protein H6822_10590 [Planctomycetaceae bacterium]|nr:hypothetical protein [Planctomycetales bacterium]MCB9922620.1 hypothetical protein [Planctomycetaceae bacterium]